MYSVWECTCVCVYVCDVIDILNGDSPLILTNTFHYLGKFIWEVCKKVILTYTYVMTFSFLL